MPYIDSLHSDERHKNENEMNAFVKIEWIFRPPLIVTINAKEKMTCCSFTADNVNNILLHFTCTKFIRTNSAEHIKMYKFRKKLSSFSSLSVTKIIFLFWYLLQRISGYLRFHSSVVTLRRYDEHNTHS